MTLEQAQAMRLHSHTGEITQIENDVDGDPIFSATAPFGVADNFPGWFIKKITYEIIASGEKCPVLVESSGTLNKYDDRNNDGVMGWRP